MTDTMATTEPAPATVPEAPAMPMRPTIDLEGLSRQLADLARPNGAEPHPGDPPKLGTTAADHMRLLTLHAADDITKLGATVRATGEAIERECVGLARLIVDRGQEVSILIKNFAALTKHVGVIHRDSRRWVTGEITSDQGQREQPVETATAETTEQPTEPADVMEATTPVDEPAADPPRRVRNR